MPRKSHRRRRKKVGQVPAPRREETTEEKEPCQLQMEAQRRHLDEILQGVKTPSREFVITQLNQRRKNESRDSADD
ncbi:hypothetical protein D1155_08050 [Anaerotruncus sp. 80]|uniref:Uncharacterized protein n=1 Tax=Anaerotruncus colihominis TaxID=169435 RepID=A0A845QI80_9FIRM|nr:MULTISPECIES: hypothetical protein [Anaerotruncus]NBH61599.1 hypothetical protein [Anaerotruncus colihominis]NCF02254.1 hypothetical protein [Anaerotruncus sp. 80]